MAKRREIRHCGPLARRRRQREHRHRHRFAGPFQPSDRLRPYRIRKRHPFAAHDLAQIDAIDGRLVGDPRIEIGQTIG
jgi:hypothetical protein